jgi:hypothetical protein
MKLIDNIMYTVGVIGVAFGGLWIVSILLYGEGLPDYVKWSDLLFLGGVIILFYYSSVKNKSDSEK